MHVTQHDPKAIDKNWTLNQNKRLYQARLKKKRIICLKPVHDKVKKHAGDEVNERVNF